MIWLLMSFAVAACSITLARSAMFIFYRRWMAKIHPLVGHLSQCHYCTSHWLALAVVLVYKPTVGGVWWCDLLIAWFALVGMAALISGVVMYFTPFTSEE